MWAALIAVAGLTLSSLLALLLIRHQGVTINGDEPHYLVEAESIGRFFTVNMSPGYSYIINHHIIYPFVAKPGPTVAAALGNSHLSHGLYLPIRSIGVSVLLAVPVLAGLKVAEVAWALMLAALAVGVIHLVSLVAGARSPRRFLAAGVFLCPVFVLATTQIYPDLMTGMIVAVAVLLLAMLEVGRQCTRAQLVTGGVLLAVMPWLAEKNIPLTVLILVLLVVAQRRAVMSLRQLVVLAGPAAASVVAAVGFNLWAYGQPLGIKNPVALVGPETFTRAMALMFDRRSGILIQLPIILLGVAALWIWRRRMPLTVVACGDRGGRGHLRQRHRNVLPDRGELLRALPVAGGPPGAGPGGPLSARAVEGQTQGRAGGGRRRRGAVGDPGGAGTAQRAPVLQPGPWDPMAYGGWWGGLDPSPILGYLPTAELYNLHPAGPHPRDRDPHLPARDHPLAQRPGSVGTGLPAAAAAATLVYCLVGLARRPSGIRPRLGPDRGGDHGDLPGGDLGLARSSFRRR